MTKTAENHTLLGARTYIAHIREYPPPPIWMTGAIKLITFFFCQWSSNMAAMTSVPNDLLATLIRVSSKCRGRLRE